MPGGFESHFEFVSGGSTSHWRDVELIRDGVTYLDQYGAFSNHLGDPILGTARMGGTSESRTNIVNGTGFDASTYTLTVPEPSSALLLLAGAASCLRRRSKSRS